MDNTLHDEEMEIHLCRIAQEVFLLMTDIELLRCKTPDQSATAVAAKLCYKIPSGMELELICEQSLAFIATKRLMSLENMPIEVNDTVRDSIAEIANMVGGNFHSILSPGMALDTTPVLIPTTADGHKVRIEMSLGAAEGAIRLRLTEAAQ